MRPRPPIPFAATPLLLVLACAAPGPVEDVLRPGEDVQPPGELPPADAAARAGLSPLERAELDQARVDAAATAARAALERDPESYERLLDAGRELFLAADLRIQRATLEVLRAEPEAELGRVLDAEDRVPRAVKEEVRALCSAGADVSERAVELDPESVAARQYLALHRTLLAWAEGAASAFLRGMGPKVEGAIEAAVELDPAYDDAAPLRLRGRFRSQAPWPLRDLAGGRADLERALAMAPIPLHYLYLGDARFAAGDAQGAAAAWRAALDAEGSGMPFTIELHRELARARLRALGGR